MEIRNTTKFVLVHFTGDPSLSYSDIKKAHLDMGQPEIGFHFIIDSQGQILMGRPTSKVGAHYPEFDQTSLGICIIGSRHEMQQYNCVNNLDWKIVLQERTLIHLILLFIPEANW